MKKLLVILIAVTLCTLCSQMDAETVDKGSGDYVVMGHAVKAADLKNLMDKWRLGTITVDEKDTLLFHASANALGLTWKP